MPATSIDISDGTREAVLGNPRFHQRLRLSSEAVEMHTLRLAWLLLTNSLQRTLIVMYSVPGTVLTLEQATVQLAKTVLTVQIDERRAIRIVREFYEHPHSWARLEATPRRTLLDYGVRHPVELTEGFVLDLLTGALDPWGPTYSSALNAVLAGLGEPLLQARVPRTFFETADKAARRRLGDLIPDVLTNRAFVLMVAGDNPLPDLRALMSAWKQLTLLQQQALGLLYPDQRAPGPILRMEVADRLGINPESLDALVVRGVTSLRSRVVILLRANPGWT